MKNITIKIFKGEIPMKRSDENFDEGEILK